MSSIIGASLRHCLLRAPRALGRRACSGKEWKEAGGWPCLTEAHGRFLYLVEEHGGGSVDLVQHERFYEIVLNNPLKRNSISGRMMNDLAKVIDTIVQESNSSAGAAKVGVVLRGKGDKAFCAGADLNLVSEVVNTSEKGELMGTFMTDALNRLRQSSLVSVCCLNGPALGGGAEIATACDYRVMSASEAVYVQFVHAKIGASPGWGGARRLSSIVGRRHALRICGTSVKVWAAEAEAAGLVDEVISPYTGLEVGTEAGTEAGEAGADAYFLAAGASFLAPFCKPFPASVRAVKTCMAAGEELEAAEAKALELEMFKQRWCSEDNNNALHSSALHFFKTSRPS
jgi:ethylmalonyl-CoA/methylmalonyl-CoA decarboxylase